MFLICADVREKEGGRTVTAGAVVFSALTNVAGLGALCFAGHPALFSLGFTATAGILCGLVAATLTIPVFYSSGGGDAPKLS